MATTDLMTPADPALVLVDPQAGLAFGVESQPREALRANLIALARTATAFSLPAIVSTSATKVYSGPVMPPVARALGDVAAIDRRSMNLFEDDAARGAVEASGRKVLLVAGLLTEACVSFTVLSALGAGYRTFVVADCCGGSSSAAHDAALRRMEAAGAVPTSWLQLLLELQRDWTRRETYDAARAIVEDHAGGYGIGLAYARDMVRPPN